jgi:hypothetical protein
VRVLRAGDLLDQGGHFSVGVRSARPAGWARSVSQLTLFASVRSAGSSGSLPGCCRHDVSSPSLEHHFRLTSSHPFMP